MMWTDVELRDLPACAARLLEEVRRADGLERVREHVLVAESLDEALVAEMTGLLEKSFRLYQKPSHLRPEAYTWEEHEGARVAKIRPLSAIQFSWAGEDVSPYVPQTVWGTGLVTHEYVETESENLLSLGMTNFDTGGGFELGALGDALCALAEDETLEDLDVVAPLKKLLVVRSLQCAELALKQAVKTAAFQALPHVEPFRFFATPGHDVPSCVLAHES